MIIDNIIAAYSFLSICTAIGKRSFENMGRIIKKSGEVVKRMLRPADESLNASRKIAQEFFVNKKQLIVTIDFTSIKKIYSQCIEGTFWFYDTKIFKSLIAYKLLLGAITDGKYTFPIAACFSFGKEFYDNPSKATQIAVQHFIKISQDLFPGVKIIGALDGAFATYELLKWAIDNAIWLELRMHSNRVVKYKGQKIKLKDLLELRPKGRQMARTIQVEWKELIIYITAVKRIDKRGNESIVYQASTYKASPSMHALIYKRRWTIEKMIRTTKQSLGLQDCFSTKISIQFNHICAVLLAYSITQVEMKKNGHANAEQAIRAIEKKKGYVLKHVINPSDQSNPTAYA